MGHRPLEGTGAPPPRPSITPDHMRTLLVFTENYIRGGGNTYLIDAVNALGPDFDRVIVAGNPDFLFPQDRARIRGPVVFKEIPFWTQYRVQRTVCRNSPLAGRAVLFAGRFLEPVMFAFHVAAFHHWLRTVAPTAVLVNNGGYPASTAALAMTVAAGVAGIPNALSIVSMPTPRRSVGGACDLLIDRLVGNAVTRLVPNANAIGLALKNLRGMPVDKLRVVYNCLPDVPPRRSLEPVVGSGEIGFFSRLDLGKGVIPLFEAFQRLSLRHPGWRLRFVGIPGDAAAALASRLASSGLRERITIQPGYEGDIPALLEEFDIYAFPSFREGFPYAILEAMRAARPIVATRVGGVPEAISEDRDGILVEPGSSEELEQALERLIRDPELRSRLAESARQRFLQDFAQENMELRFRAVFSELLSNPLRRTSSD